MDRRLFLGSAAALALAPPVAARTLSILAPPVPAPLPLRPRVYGAVRPARLDDYKAAIAAMLALPVTDPRNWYRQALLHVFDCPHGNWWFLPWHRAYLSQFERIGAELIGKPDFRIPYWDWTESPTVPDAFFDDGLDPNSAVFKQDSNVLFAQLDAAIADWSRGLSTEEVAEFRARGRTPAQWTTRARGIWSRTAGPRLALRTRPGLADYAVIEVSAEKVKAALDIESFEYFASYETASHHEPGGGGALESGPHDNVHGGTGGLMGDFMSPVDPVFWLHHANLDRLWSVWSARQAAAGRAAQPPGAEFGREMFRFFTDPSGRRGPVAAGACLDPASFGYAYETGSPQLDAPIAFRPRASSLLARSSSPFNAKLREGFESSTALDVDRSAFTNATGEVERGVLAQITLVPPDDTLGVRMKVFINCPYLSDQTPVGDPHYVGAITFFAAEHHEGHGMPVTKTLTLGPTLDRLRERGQLPRSAIRVQLIPVAPASADGEIGGSLETVSIVVR